MLGNSVRTIEIHRANVFDKMKVKSAVELARLVERYASTQ
jgi:two-component system response regulator DctR